MEIDRIDRALLRPLLEEYILSGRPHQLITANLHFMALAKQRPDFMRTIAAADLVLCDGKPLQWASLLQGKPIPTRITGMDLVLTAAELSARRGYHLFFLGGMPRVAERAARAIERLMPGVSIVGTRSLPYGPIEPDENADILAEIQRLRPHVLFVAKGAPQQEEWIHTHLAALNVPICVGVGGIFNVFAGDVQRAPMWVQWCGMEWAFRLAQEPKRLWRRYLLDDLPLFFSLLARQAPARWQISRNAD
jgi:N-acetylglucosaminyldiphosphoundecaprenol N-acetyl-beta-D-mannosaminyltransferase